MIIMSSPLASKILPGRLRAIAIVLFTVISGCLWIGFSVDTYFGSDGPFYFAIILDNGNFTHIAPSRVAARTTAACAANRARRLGRACSRHASATRIGRRRRAPRGGGAAAGGARGGTAPATTVEKHAASVRGLGRAVGRQQRADSCVQVMVR